MIALLLGRLKDWALAALAVLTAVGAALLYGRSTGRREAEERATAQRTEDALAGAREGLQAAQERNDAEADIARLDDGSAGERLRDDWGRN
jgi:hypothetical protein